MKNSLIIISLLFISFWASSQQINPEYDSIMAKSLGADEYGMKSYVLVMLKTGSCALDDKALVDSLFAGHLENIGQLAQEGKLVVAGPMGKNEHGYRGIFILNVTTAAEANAILQSDPAIQSKLLEAELYSWYGSAALPVYLNEHRKIEKYRIL